MYIGIVHLLVNMKLASVCDIHAPNTGCKNEDIHQNIHQNIHSRHIYGYVHGYLYTIQAIHVS